VSGPTPVEQADDAVTVAGRWTYRWGARKRPNLHPVTTPAGALLTRDAPDDHPWHHGLWFTVKFVDEDNFWEEMAPYGVLRHDGPPEVEVRKDGSVRLRGALRWIRPDRETVAIEEQRELAHVPIDGDSYAIDLDTTLVPTTDARLDRTPFTTWGGYGGLAFRGSGELVDTRILLADRSEHDRVLGVPSTWCDLTGTVDGAAAGIALLDHPGNRRHPVPFYGSTRADTYGEGWSNFLNAAFLWDEPIDITAGEALRVRHRVIVHDGRWDADRLDAAWAAWVNG
jgi:hypothetical protein